MAIGDAEEYHDNIQTVIIRNSGEEVSRRPYTAEEIAQVNARATQQSNANQLISDATTAINQLLTTINGLQVIIDKSNAALGPNDIRDLARGMKVIARQLSRLTRLMVNKLDSSDVGSP